MKDLLALPWDVYAVPVGAIVVAFGVHRILKVSQFFALLGALLPLGLPHSEIPFAPELSKLQPYYQVVGGWGVFCIIAATWVLLRSCFRVAGGAIGVVRLVYHASLCASFLLAGVLFMSPNLLHVYAPGWRESGGPILLTTATIGVGVSFLKIFKSAVQLLVWSLVVVVLGSEIFFQKLPMELEREDLEIIERVLPDGLVNATMRHLTPVSSALEDSLRFATSKDVES